MTAGPIRLLATTIALALPSLGIAQTLPALLQPHPQTIRQHVLTAPPRLPVSTADSHPYIGATLGVLYATTALSMCCSKDGFNEWSTKYYLLSPMVIAASIPTMMPDGWGNRDRFFKNSALGYGIVGVGAALTAHDRQGDLPWPLFMLVGQIAISGWWSNRQ